jgi:hypothetical protein
MKKFMELFGEKTIGCLSGWDRLAFRGTLRWLASKRGVGSYLSCNGILFKDFGRWAESLTQRVRAACEDVGKSLGIRMEYLRSSTLCKEERARKIAKQDGIETGPICMFSVVEPCYAPTVVGNRETKQLELVVRPRKCLWFYFYWNDPDHGFGHMRMQSWLPFTIKSCLNGRHWLERQLLAEGLAYKKSDNTFRWIADCERAQLLLDEQLKTDWPALFNEYRRLHFGVVDSLFGSDPLHYYWSAESTEWATDIMFRSTNELDHLFPCLVRHGILLAQSPAVMRFLGRKNATGALPGEVMSDLRKRYEGVRLKHWVNRNSVKVYNKAGNVLRVETTINNTRDFKMFRHPNDDDTRPASWQKLRKGVSDLHRRAQVSQASNERYVEHLAASSAGEPLERLLGGISRPVTRNGRRFRAINPWDVEDFRMLQFIARGEMNINGFRNRDLRDELYPKSKTADRAQQRRASGRVTRRLALLRAHGLIRKIPKENRYVLSAKGRKVTAAFLAASSADAQRLMETAA